MCFVACGISGLPKIQHQRQGSIVIPPPAHLEPAAVCGHQFSRIHLLAKRFDQAWTLDEVVLRQQSFLKKLEVCNDGWQDGQMGHEQMMPSHLNLSHCADDALDSGLELISPSIQQWPHFQPALQLGVMASGNGSNFEAIQESISAHELHADIRLLVVNNRGCGAEKRAQRLNIPCQLLDHRQFETRERLDHALVTAFLEAGVDLIVMAGWMRIVTPVLIEAFPNRLLNIHPSLLPSFKGLDAVGQALQASVRISGCTAHLVQADVDTGPVIAQAAVPVLQDDSPASLATRIQSQEHRILPWAIALAGLKWRQALALSTNRDQG